MELVEQLLLEKTRDELIQKSQRADIVKRYGTTRWEGRNRVDVFDTIKNYNRLDFNALFKGDLLNFVVPVKGETNDYSVEVLFEGICKKLQDELKRNNYKLEYKIVYRAIVNAINAGDILVSCTCPDFKYRQSYQRTMGKYNAGRPELRPAKITNPNDTKGAGCKHVMNVIGNLDWAMRLAACINNYVFYIRDHMPELFQQIIWPAISGLSYEQGEEQGMFDDLASTVGDINSEGTGYDNVDTTEVDTANDEETTYNVEEPEEYDDWYMVDEINSEGE